MEAWGCEYLDDYQPEIFSIEYKFTLPMSVISQCVDKHLITKIKTTEWSKVEKLIKIISNNQEHGCGELTIGGNGVTLSDGNHRYCAYEYLQKDRFPVIIKIENGKIKQGGITNKDIIKYLLENL